MSSSFSISEFINTIRSGTDPDAADISAFVQNLSTTPPELVAAFLAHAFHKTLSAETTTQLTLAMRDSGKIMNWQDLGKPVLDKHSTGGVGDKITICLAPLLAALGFAVPTVMGRGLGFTGGTVDKFEAIPGMKLEWRVADAEKLVREFGLVFSAQSHEIAPADKILYAMRDVTGTVESIPLITASILSKKLAESLGTLIMDVKWGSGAFMSSQDSARDLAKSIVRVANLAGTKTRALITSMNDPIGEVSGHWSEVAEAVRILKNEHLSPAETETRDLTLAIATHGLVKSGVCTTEDQAKQKTKECLDSGKPFEIFLKIVRAQGGDPTLFEKSFPVLKPATHQLKIAASRSGFLNFSSVKNLGQALVLAKAGRQKKSDQIDHNVYLHHTVKTGSKIQSGDTIMTLGFNDTTYADSIKKLLESSFEILEQKTEKSPLIQEIIP